jgi:lipoprotein NlpI
MLFVYGAPGARFDFMEASDVVAPAGQIDAKYDDDIRTHPDSVVAYLARGWARRSHGALKEALADFDKAAALDSKMPDVYRARYSVALGRSDFAAAEADSNTVIALEAKDDVRGYYMRGLVRRTAGRYDEALADFDKAESLIANTDLVALERAITLFCLGRYTDASFTLSRHYHGIYPPYAQAWVHVLSTKSGTEENWLMKQYEPDLGWTSRIFTLYRGQKTAADVETDMAAAESDPVRKSYWSCEARFFLAEYRLEHGDVAGARAGLTDITPANCASVVGPARAELGRLPAN